MKYMIKALSARIGTVFDYSWKRWSSLFSFGFTIELFSNLSSDVFSEEYSSSTWYFVVSLFLCLFQFVFAALNSLSIWHTSCNRSFNNGILLVGSVLGSALCGILSRVERWHILLVCIMILFFVCHLYKDNWTVNYCSYFLSLPGNVTLNSPFRFRAS